MEKLCTRKIKISNRCSTCQVRTEAEHEQGAGGCRSVFLTSSGVGANPIGEPEFASGAPEYKGCPALEIIRRFEAHRRGKSPPRIVYFCVQNKAVYQIQSKLEATENKAKRSGNRWVLKSTSFRLQCTEYQEASNLRENKIKIPL
jgi:hypothetical protein